MAQPLTWGCRCHKDHKQMIVPFLFSRRLTCLQFRVVRRITWTEWFMTTLWDTHIHHSRLESPRSPALWLQSDRHLVLFWYILSSILELFRRIISGAEMRLLGILCTALALYLGKRLWVSQEQSRGFPCGSKICLQLCFCEERVTDTLGSFFLCRFRSWRVLCFASFCWTNLLYK